MSERELWAAVVLLASDDIASQDYGSFDFNQAVAFFCGDGEWAKSRQAIADTMNLHVNDLERLGRTAMAARIVRDGPLPVIERPAPVVRPQPPTVSQPAAVVSQFNSAKMRRMRGGAPALVRQAAEPRPPAPIEDLKPAKRRAPDPAESRGGWVKRFVAGDLRRSA